MGPMYLTHLPDPKHGLLPQIDVVTEVPGFMGTLRVQAVGCCVATQGSQSSFCRLRVVPLATYHVKVDGITGSGEASQEPAISVDSRSGMSKMWPSRLGKISVETVGEGFVWIPETQLDGSQPFLYFFFGRFFIICASSSYFRPWNCGKEMQHVCMKKKKSAVPRPLLHSPSQ